jgi:hypothetical protein
LIKLRATSILPAAPEHGKDAFHRAPDLARNEWDAMERVLAILEDRFRARGAGADSRQNFLPAAVSNLE